MAGNKSKATADLVPLVSALAKQLENLQREIGSLRDEYFNDLVDSINKRAVPDLDLLDTEKWDELRFIQMSRESEIDPKAWKRLCNRRKRLFCEQWDRSIIRAAQADSIHNDFLKSPKCWQRICQVRGLNPKLFSQKQWTRLCQRRGHAGVAPSRRKRFRSR